MNWSNVTFHLLKYESVRQKENEFEQQQQKTSLNNNSFSIPTKQEQLQEKIRCKSDQCDEFGNYSNKYKIFHDLIVEFPQHKKQRLTQIIVQNLSISFLIQKKIQSPFNKILLEILLLNHKDHKIMSQALLIKDQKILNIRNKKLIWIVKLEWIYIIRMSKKLLNKRNFLKLRLILALKLCILVSLVALQEKVLELKPLKVHSHYIIETTNKFILKQTLQKTNIIDKIICESKINQKTTYSPRSIVNHQHKKTNSSGHSAYSEQNKFLRRIIGNSLFIKTLNKQL
ncbi:unnamed protein product [Paramecium primaurelia]|uniref:Uncharacterized protein n=1 Tax=Paramecium primaurelia TaxID=5886 RepID=A0A8S1NRJ3_PARPR|nr:unnamed protein product [Paramecium primaurelia]